MKVSLVVTGFSHFTGVEDNPTARLVNWLSRACKNGNPAEEVSGWSYLMKSCDVLAVSISAVDQWVARLPKDQTSDCVILVHLGVDIKRHGLFLEERAYNEKNFRQPDVDGCAPCHEAIEPSHCLESHLCTRLDLQEVAQQLQGLGYEVQVSQDAGRYVCNYTYYRSLEFCSSCEDGNVYSLFVHVPPFEDIDEESQRCFLLSLLEMLCQQVLTARTRERVPVAYDLRGL